MSFLKRFWKSIQPSKEALQGSIFAAIATVLWAIFVGASSLESGFGLWVDLLFALLVAVLAIPLVMFVTALLLMLLRVLPPRLTGFFLACGLLISALWFSPTGGELASVLFFVECALGATLATIVTGNLRTAPSAKRIVTLSIFVLAIAANIGFVSLLHSDGTQDDLLEIKDKQPNPPSALSAENPSKSGPYHVKTLYYGSGDSLRRPEFGPGVAIRTAPVNASPFFKDFSGWKAWLRKRYWGFGTDKLPLNAQVFYPEGAGPFPLFVFVHGNHSMSVPSDKGYAYLCKLLASRGFIAVSVDENFLNSGLFHDPPKQQAVRGWLLLEHLRLWHAWANDVKSPFYGKVDLNQIAVGGHSRGGEAAATAALFNKLQFYPEDATVAFHYGYNIRSVVAIAPADGQYKPAEQWRILKDVSYLTLQGSNDSDVSSFDGSRQYDHVHFSGDVPAFKSELYIYRANHGQFNTVWGRTDLGTPINWFLNLRPLLPPDDQRQISKLYISAFLEATLHNHAEYQDMFRDYRRAQQWLPKTFYVNRFQDQSYKTISSFDEDADVTTTTAPGGHISATGLSVWREGKIPFRSGDRDYNGVFVGWNWQKLKKPPAPPPNYTVDLPTGLTGTALALSVATTDDEAPDRSEKHPQPSDDTGEEKDEITDFSIEAESANGVTASLPLSSTLLLLPPFHVQFTKLEWLDNRMYKNAGEPTFQSIHVPFAAFQQANPAFNPAQIKRIRLIFDKTPSRVIIISAIGLENN